MCVPKTPENLAEAQNDEGRSAGGIALAQDSIYYEFGELTNLLHQILFVINQPDVYRSPSSNTWM
jgi:hypothetical protein